MDTRQKQGSLQVRVHKNPKPEAQNEEIPCWAKGRRVLSESLVDLATVLAV